MSEDFGIDYFSLNQAFMGMPAAPKKQAIKVCEWALVVAARDSLDAGGDLLRAWAKKRKVGMYHPEILAGES